MLKSEHRDCTSEKESSRNHASKKKCTMKKSALFRLDPFVSDDGLLRVGGRLRRTRLEYGEKHPVLLLKGHHVSKLIVRHYHGQVHHQGRQIRHGAIRQAGYWLVDRNHTVSRELSLCVVCKNCEDPPWSNGRLTCRLIGWKPLHHSPMSVLVYLAPCPFRPEGREEGPQA